MEGGGGAANQSNDYRVIQEPAKERVSRRFDDGFSDRLCDGFGERFSA